MSPSADFARRSGRARRLHGQAGHDIILLELNESSVDWQVRVWCDPKIYWKVWDATVLATKKALDAAKVTIPFPQRDVHLDKSA